MADFRCAGDPDNSIYQCRPSDFTILGKGGTRLTDEINHPEHQLGGVRITVRFQKNRDNGQLITQAANHDSPDFCIVRAVQRMKHRALRLGIESDQPCCVYRRSPGSKKPSFFHTSIIRDLLCKMATRTYNIDTKTEKLLYSGHSIRVGAAVLLNAAGFDGHDIKKRLRWRSDSFLMYLRNVPKVAFRHMPALNETDVDFGI
jgi:hypothetical protein